ncbi:MAG TPA: aldehyde dehydrogenase [Brumimicrobium sp.]|nr:aldehyde dehydrogenase [Brumimicrobium sp.]
MKEIVQNQYLFFDKNATKSIAFRKEQLKKLDRVLRDNEKAIYESIYMDFKKSKFDVFSTELAMIYADISDALANLNSWSKRKRVRTNLVNFPAKSYIYPEPLGTVLVIGAWNYPFLLSIAPAVAAIAAGNTVVIKPSEVPARTSAVIADIINENFDASFFHVVEGGVDVTTELLAQKWDKIFFTGSTGVGKIVYQAAAKNLTPVTLELGGKSPAFVMKDANLDVTVNRLVWGKFLNAGQTCIAPDYLLVEKSIKDELLKKLKARIVEMDFSFFNENYPQIINERNYQRLKSLIEDDKIYYAGEFNEEKRYFPPVLMNEVNFSDKVMEEEIFGPIFPVLSFENLDDAIKEVKALPKPLACYVFTKDKGNKRKVLNELSFGGGAINDAVMHIANPNMPFGGVGNSGMGSYHGKSGFDAFSHQKSVLDKATWIDPYIRYNKVSDNKLKLFKFLFRV